MSDNGLQVFLHAQGAKPRVIMASGSETIRELLARAGIMLESAEAPHTFVGECEEALSEPLETEDGVDEHAPAELGLTLEVLDLKRHRHVHVHTCKRVAVDVHFGGKTKHHKFSPATTVETATKWATKKFHLDPAAAAEYVLQFCNSIERPRSDKHLGELVDGSTCALCFDLVKEVTPQG
jgi:hypothetical protein